MKNYLNYIKESNNSELDKLFLDLIHLNELEIRFNFIDRRPFLFYVYNNSGLFGYSKIRNIFYINENKILKILKILSSKYKTDYITLKYNNKMIIEKYFKLNNINTSYNNFGSLNVLL